MGTEVSDTLGFSLLRHFPVVPSLLPFGMGEYILCHYILEYVILFLILKWIQEIALSLKRDFEPLNSVEIERLEAD